MDEMTIYEFFVTHYKIKRIALQSIDMIDGKAGKSKRSLKATILQSQALACIQEKEKLTIGELSSTLRMSSGATAQLVDRLIANKWISRKVSTKDKRVAFLQLTTNGKNELKDVQTRTVAYMKKYMQFISPADFKEIVRISKDFLTKLEQSDIQNA